MVLTATTVIKCARWLDAEQTKLVVVTNWGIGNWPKDSPIGQKAIASVPIHPFYTVKSARHHEEDRTKLVARVHEHDDEVELHAPLWPDVLPGAQFIPPGLVGTIQVAEPQPAAVLDAGPDAPIIFADLPPAPPRRPWSLNQLLDRASDPIGEPIAEQPELELPITEPAPEMQITPEEIPEDVPAAAPLDDAARRRGAKARIRSLAASFSFEANAERLRYERALLAHNGNVVAIQDMEREGVPDGLTVQQFAEQIIDARPVHSRRMLRVKTIHDDALKALDLAQGDEIEAVEQRARTALAEV